MTLNDGQGGPPGRIVTFYSYKGGTGRTMTLANVAWILAANGQRVLAVDWDLEAPGLHRFFHPFLDPGTVRATTGVIDLIREYAWAAADDPEAGERQPDWHRAYARIRSHAVSLDWLFPSPGTLDLVLAGRQGRDYASSVTSFDWDHFYDALGGGLFLDALRADMREHYDYVLIDSRTGLSDIADICTAHLPDVLVDCFTLSDQSIDGAAAVAHEIHERFRGRSIRILPVPMRIDEGEKEKADAGRALARKRFDGLPADLDGEGLTAYWGAVEIPYRPYYAYEETLAAFGDEPGNPTSLLSAFERLTGVITDRAVSRMPPMPYDVRDGVRRKFGRSRIALTSELRLSYVSEDRMWADWIVDLLARAGFRVSAKYVGGPDDGAEEPAGRTLFLLSPAYQRSSRARHVWDTANAGENAHRGQVVAVRVGPLPPATVFGEQSWLDLVGTDERNAAAALLRVLGRPVQPAQGVDGAAVTDTRFPGTVPRLSNLPSRNSHFTGRSALLERLRDTLGRGTDAEGASTMYALCGLGGVGKTQIALEYAHRFAADHDVVWWISAESPESVIDALSNLARRLGLRTGDDAALGAREALDHLWQTPGLRWLLVFDNADEPQDVSRYFPGGAGRVLVTSRNRAWQQRAEIMEIEPFLRAESIERLLLRAADLRLEDAERVAAAVGDLPLALDQAGAWLAETGTPVDLYLAALEEQALQVMSLGRPANYPEPVGATWNVSIERLKERSPAAVRLLQLCAFFAAEPISMTLLYSDRMVSFLAAAEPALQERMLVGRVIREIGRFALARVDAVTLSIQVHRLVQAVIRSGLTPHEQRETQHIVHRILVSVRPSGDEPVDYPENGPLFEAIWPHLKASGAAECDEPETRALLMDRVRHLWRRGDLNAALSLADDLRERWQIRLAGSEDLDLQVQLLRLQCHTGNVLRSLGRYDEAAELGFSTLSGQRALLTPGHPHTLMTASALAADLGSLGRFDEALELATEAHTGFEDIFGANHPRTLNARNNLALCLRLLGRYDEARTLDEEVYALRRTHLGGAHPHTLFTLTILGRDLRDTGHYEKSVAELSTSHELCKENLGEDHPETLRTAKSLAVSLRRAGRVEEALGLTERTLEHYRLRETPVTTPDVLDCTLNHACDLYAAGVRGRALHLAQDVVGQYRAALGERHPATLDAVNNLGVFLSGSAEHARARLLLERNLAALRTVLGERHPHTLACSVNLANVLAELGESARAEELEKAAVAGFSSAVGASHPDTVAARANLAVTQRALGRAQESHALRAGALADFERVLGAEHPHTVTVREGGRIHLDLEPPVV
ncbi:FxSxx-COOH system tetratricopeptide repeat protein [Streptomyces sp. NPDC090106]|uniref:FxSxx-COOH system tetratricopeptide repeat protein n=1 Tax=Streptomyces sp. NPDC090106 TaxID=3365946 RepID=UPI00381AD53D